jgi:hypothetical protein
VNLLSLQAVRASANAVGVHCGSFGRIRWREEKLVVAVGSAP